MKTSILILCLAIGLSDKAATQSTETTGHVIEGGKLIVELVKALTNKKDVEKDPGCKGRYADLCIENASASSITVFLEHLISDDRREVVILPQGKECALQIGVGVWTYDLRITGVQQSLRKGDVRIEGCNHLNMKIK